MNLIDLLVVMNESQNVSVYRTDFVDWCTTRLFIGTAGDALKSLKEYHLTKVGKVGISVGEHENYYVYIEVLEE